MRSALAFSLAIVAMLAPVQFAVATACDTFDGQRSEHTSADGAYLSDEIGKLNFLPISEFPDTPAGGDDVLGVDKDKRTGSFNLVASYAPGKLVFDLSQAGKSGKITFIVPSKYTEFTVDTRERQEKNPRKGPPLYAEWRLSGTVQLDGIFAVTTRKSRAQLILHGRGNSCRSADDFHAWTLIVKGGGASFTLLGRFK